jgi:hypothetical protein
MKEKCRIPVKSNNELNLIFSGCQGRGFF